VRRDQAANTDSRDRKVFSNRLFTPEQERLECSSVRDERQFDEETVDTVLHRITEIAANAAVFRCSSAPWRSPARLLLIARAYPLRTIKLFMRAQMIQSQGFHWNTGQEKKSRFDINFYTRVSRG
jgi:hypothetical protein